MSNSESIPLSKLELLKQACIEEIDAPRNIERKLNDLGFFPGVNLHVSSKAPLGDPIVVNFNDYNLSVRNDIAKYVKVKVLPE